MSDFSQTVDLKEQMEQKKKARKKPATKPVASKRVEKDALDEMYEEEKSNNIKNIDRPVEKIKKTTGNNQVIYQVIIVVLVLALGYFAFFDQGSKEEKTVYAPKWYKVFLVNGEYYYGYVQNPEANPVVIEKVYYDYDQLNSSKTGTEQSETGDIRLVKRGEETHGPDGTLTVYQAQIDKFEGLDDDSNVLRAILANENK
jgi:hypothetical protein